MRVLVFMKGNEETEAGQLPDEKVISAMMTYNEELVKAGVLLAAEGLYPSARGARVHLSRGRSSVTDGPFAEAKELVAGFWLWQVRDMDEAVEWVKRLGECMTAGGVSMPDDQEAVLEIRPVFEADDFGKEFTPELRAQEEQLRAQVASRS